MTTVSKIYTKAPNLTTTDIKATVDGLNRPPFMCNLSLVEFDDKMPLELLELLNKFLAHLDSVHKAADVTKETQEQLQERICSFLKVLGYPCDYSPQYSRDIAQGDKRTIQHILYWLVLNQANLQRKAYTAKFLVPLDIPDEFLMDDEMQEINQVFKDMQAEFQATHQNLEQLRGESMNPNDLKKEISQLEQEKDQLLSKIRHFKNKPATGSDFQPLLEATSKLRKEQEQDARLGEKEMELTNQIDVNENNLMMMKQKLMDTQKMSQENYSPEQMLSNLKTEVRKQRELNTEILMRELTDKRERLSRTEMLLQEPVTTQSELERLSNDCKRLQMDIQSLEQKIQQMAPKEDKLAIYRSQANAITKRREQKDEEMKKLEVEKKALEQSMSQKEAEYTEKKGGKYMKRDDFKQYAANLRVKNNQFKDTKKVLAEIKSEVTVLARTESILKSRADNLEEFMEGVEKKQGIQGYTSVENRIQGASEQTENLNQLKDKSLAEINQIIKQIDEELKSKKQKLAPEIKKLRELRQQFTEIETEYMNQKKNYEATVFNLESEQEKTKGQVDNIYKDYQGDETRFHQNNIMTEINEALLKRVSNEAKYLKQPDSRLSKDYKSYQEYFSAKLKQQESIMRDLKAHQSHIKDNSSNFATQKKLFSDLKYLLEMKKATVMKDGNDLRGYQDTQAQGFDRFVVREDI